MPPVAFLCGACKRPLWVEESARGTVAPCGACGATCRVPADAPALAEATLADPGGEGDPATLVDLAALPVIDRIPEKTLENKVFQTDTPQQQSDLKLSSGKTFPWLLLWMTASFSILSAILAIYLVLRLRAADEALRKRAVSATHSAQAMSEQKRGRINHLAFG